MKRKAKAKAHSTKSHATNPIVLRRIADLERRMTRLEDGHSGDPAKHAALGTGQPASDAAEAADASSEEAA